MEEGVPANGSDLASVIQQSKIPFRCSVKLLDLDVSKPADEIPPNLGPDPVTYRKSHLVAPIVGFLSPRKREES